VRVGRYTRNEAHDDGEQEKDQEVERDETTPTTRSFLGEEDLDSVVVDWTYREIGLTSLFWNSSVHRIKDEITENGENLEQWPNMIFVSEASKE
jgi:hypothetical protein